MANTFTRAKQANVGTTPTNIYTVPTSTVAVTHAIFLTNVLSTDITVTVSVGGVNVLKNLPIKANSTALPNKPVNMVAGDILTVVSNTNTSLDVYLSILEIN